MEETADERLRSPNPRNIQNDPCVKDIRPVRLCGEVKKKEGKINWELNPNISVLGSVAIQLGHLSGTWIQEKEVFMQIHGRPSSTDDFHHEYNAAAWDIYEDAKEEAGIPRHFRGALLATIPKNPPLPIAVKVTVTAKVGSRTDNLRHRLRSVNDDPIFLDRKTPKPESRKASYGGVNQDFADPNFPWDSLDAFIAMPFRDNKATPHNAT